jgi:esterase/lipase superfamily enzyme
MPMKLGSTTELGRFPPIPYEVSVLPEGIRRSRQVVEAYRAAKQKLQAEIARTGRALASRKEVVLFVHGYHTSFESAALTMGELCHFLGREFVCGIFTWPAGGSSGILLGYDCRPRVVRVRDRGPRQADPDRRERAGGRARSPDLAPAEAPTRSPSALAQLSAEAYSLQSSPEREFRIGSVVLIAPDLDGDGRRHQNLQGLLGSRPAVRRKRGVGAR